MHIPHSREIAVDFFEKYVTQESSHLKGLNVYDLSTGSGYIVNLFHKQNAKVHLYDLIPDNNQFCEVTCYYLNMQHVFPIENDVADLVICSETIEHLPNQYLFFQEISRILVLPTLLQLQQDLSGISAMAKPQHSPTLFMLMQTTNPTQLPSLLQMHVALILQKEQSWWRN